MIVPLLTAASTTTGKFVDMCTQLQDDDDISEVAAGSQKSFWWRIPNALNDDGQDIVDIKACLKNVIKVVRWLCQAAWQMLSSHARWV